MVMKYRNTFQNSGDALKKLWDGRCDVYVKEMTVNPANGRDEPTEVPKFKNEPCRISFSSVSSTSENNNAELVQQTTKLFIAKEVEIPPGSKLIITQKGKTEAYQRSGKPAVYSCHQEITIELFEGWA